MNEDQHQHVGNQVRMVQLNSEPAESDRRLDSNIVTILKYDPF